MGSLANDRRVVAIRFRWSELGNRRTTSDDRAKVKYPVFVSGKSIYTFVGNGRCPLKMWRRGKDFSPLF